MNGILSTLLPLLAKLIPLAAGNSSIITTIVNGLVQVTPVLIQEYQDVLPFVKNIIATLKGDDTTTQAQLQMLAALDAQVDAAFDAASAAAQAEDGSTA